jgi:hypothetical protein
MADEAPSILGRSLRVDDGDLAIVNHDLQVVADDDNFAQSAAMIIDTPFATDVFNVNYGFAFLDAVSKPREVRHVKELLRMNLVQSFSRDDRVRDVVDVIFDDDPRYAELLAARSGRGAAAVSESLRAELRSQRKNSRQWQALVLLRLVNGTETAIGVSGVGV